MAKTNVPTQVRVEPLAVRIEVMTGGHICSGGIPRDVSMLTPRMLASAPVSGVATQVPYTSGQYALPSSTTTVGARCRSGDETSNTSTCLVCGADLEAGWPVDRLFALVHTRAKCPNWPHLLHKLPCAGHLFPVCWG